MGYWDDVNPRSVNEASDGFSEFALGDNDAFIDKVEEKVSESGNDMLVITFAKSNGVTIKHFIVDGEYKLSKLKQLYIAFNIPVGETDIRKWLGKTGIVVCKEGKPFNGKVYNQVSYLRPKQGATNVNRPANNKPSQPAQGNGWSGHHAEQLAKEVSDDGFTDDIPF